MTTRYKTPQGDEEIYEVDGMCVALIRLPLALGKVELRRFYGPEARDHVAVCCSYAHAEVLALRQCAYAEALS